MAYGAGAELLSNVEGSENWITDPKLFWKKTRKDHVQLTSFAAPGQGQKQRVQLKRAGLYTRLWVLFDGQFTVTTANVTMDEGAPYSLISELVLKANGSEVWQCSGVDLKVLDHTRYPAFVDQTDDLPGSTTLVGGETLAVGTHDVALTWVIPISPDDMSCNAGLYAQADAINLELAITQANDTDLCSSDPNFAVTGTFYVVAEMFEIPRVEGKVIIPDLSMVHRFIAVEKVIEGQVSRPGLLRSEGNLMRLLVSGRSADNTPLRFDPQAAAANRVLKVELEYGVNERPFSYDPAWALVQLNNRHYGTAVPYDRVILDFIKENPIRDAVHMMSLTELALKVQVDPAVALVNGQSFFRLVQETIG